MKCPKCNNEMRIQNSFTEAVNEDGVLAVYSVVDLHCDDPQCADGMRGVPTARLRRRIENRAAGEYTVSCCGIPLAYTDKTAYTIPDASVIVQTMEDRVVLQCKRCGKQQTLMTEGKEKI